MSFFSAQPNFAGGRLNGHNISASVPINNNGLHAFATQQRLGDPFGKGINCIGGGLKQDLGAISSAHVAVRGTKFGTEASAGFRLNF